MRMNVIFWDKEKGTKGIKLLLPKELRWQPSLLQKYLFLHNLFLEKTIRVGQHDGLYNFRREVSCLLNISNILGFRGLGSLSCMQTMQLSFHMLDVTLSRHNDTVKIIFIVNCLATQLAGGMDCPMPYGSQDQHFVEACVIQLYRKKIIITCPI